MNLKRRSLSESRKVEYLNNEDILSNQLHRAKNTPCFPTNKGTSRRRTSAEMISEAKTFLSNGNSPRDYIDIVNGVRVINTCRPITPREPSRILNGTTSLAERPPSVVRLRYLQNENYRSAPTKTPALEPITSKLPSHEGKVKEVMDNYVGKRYAHSPTAPAAMAVAMKSGKLELSAQTTIENLVKMLKEHAGLKECAPQTITYINSILRHLYERLRRKEERFKKEFVLSGLYGLVECTAPEILLAVAKVVLALRVFGSNLTGACKLIFKVSRNEKNDYLFHDNDVLELFLDGLGRASPLEDPEACIYGYGAIRFLTFSTYQDRFDPNSNCAEMMESSAKRSIASPAVLDDCTSNERPHKLSKQNALMVRLAQNGAVQLLILHLQMLNEAAHTKGLEGRLLHALYQLSAALRAMADVNQYFITTEEQLKDGQANETKRETYTKHFELACPYLINAAEITAGEIDVQVNIIRTLSVLSDDAECCRVLINYAARLGVLLGPYCNNSHLATKEKPLFLINRLAYILGNIMATFDDARLQFYYNDVAIEYLINVLNTYSKEPLTFHNSMGDNVVDALIKIIRVVANMSVSAEVGYGLCKIPLLGKTLLDIFNGAYCAKITKKEPELDELIFATLGALHNLCFYHEKLTPTTAHQVVTPIEGSLQSILLELTKTLGNTMQQCHEQAILIEIARVLGNLTRNEMARQQFCEANGLHLLLLTLNGKDSNGSYDLKVCSIGVLVNLLGDTENHKPFTELKGEDILTSLLRDALHHPPEWLLATIICQAFWNLFVDTKPVAELCTDVIVQELYDLLIDNVNVNEKHQVNASASIYEQLRENFTMVATELLQYLHHGVLSATSKHMDNKENEAGFQDAHN